MKKKSTTLFHVRFKAGGDHYFGGISAIYTMFSATTLGVSQSRLYSFDVEEDKPYENAICIINKGNIVRKKGHRRNGKVSNNSQV